MLTFQVNMQTYAGIQQAHSMPQVGQSSGYSSACRAINLAPASGFANDWTTGSVLPFGLTMPAAGTGVKPGAFRITMPPFQPPVVYNVGTAIEVNGDIVLSSFTVAKSNSNTECQPVMKYFVQTGSYTPGTVMNFAQSSVNAALCDFTPGYSVIDVTLNADGTWTVQYIQ
ncbi:hypothetical protein IMCC20628_02562 [Hoeflea sp. IMCC20628]|uniref:hypothetical protein n=1 Tax=Hoeflea sp. IMCC20628 TaxID=1620421 RepID=UPI00063A8F4A|nr:hypothetical protein [Hoeflea sp. IMCC20628]AKI01260.1 hypothetical protein IMCC20628_02562 [Hoeflea sp. IMCC20628]